LYGEILEVTKNKDRFSFLDWMIHFGIAINMVVVVYILWYVASH